MFGKSRGTKMTRLTATVDAGATEIFVEPGQDLKAGDRIGILATAL